MIVDPSKTNAAPPTIGLRRAIVRMVLAVQNVYRRYLGVFFALIGPKASYAISAVLAKWLYRLLDPLRLSSEAQCKAALAGRISPQEIPPLAEQAFVHRIWNLVDMMLAERFLHPGTFRRFGGGIDERSRQRLIDAQRRRCPLILVSAYYGPYDLLPLFLGYNGIKTTAVYLPYDNPAYDRFRQRIRGRGGCHFVPVDQAAGCLPAILEAGGTVALVADHHAERGMPVTFLGLPTRAMRTVGLLAARYNAAILVAGIRRVNNQFRFELIFGDLLESHQWQHLADPVEEITRRYLEGLEKIILADPSQYLWAQPRWGKQVLEQLREQQAIEPPSSDS